MSQGIFWPPSRPRESVLRRETETSGVEWSKKKLSLAFSLSLQWQLLHKKVNNSVIFKS